MPHFKPLGPVVSKQKSFKVFPFGCHGNQGSAWNQIFLKILVKGVARIIPGKFG